MFFTVSHSRFSENFELQTADFVISKKLPRRKPVNRLARNLITTNPNYRKISIWKVCKTKILLAT